MIYLVIKLNNTQINVFFSIKIFFIKLLHNNMKSDNCIHKLIFYIIYKGIILNYLISKLTSSVIHI